MINSTLGASVDFVKGFSVRGIYDGKEPHLMFNYFYKQHGSSLMYIWLGTFGVAMLTAFCPDLFVFIQGQAIKKANGQNHSPNEALRLYILRISLNTSYFHYRVISAIHIHRFAISHLLSSF